MSLADAERIARVFANGGVLDGKRIFSEDFVAHITTGQKIRVWEPVGEGELAVITRALFDSWRGLPSLDRSQLSALESLVDTPIPLDDFDRLLDERLGRDADLFKNELAKGQKAVFERRWRVPLGFGAFAHDQAVVVLTRTKLIAVYASPRPAFRPHALIPLLRALE